MNSRALTTALGLTLTGAQVGLATAVAVIPSLSATVIIGAGLIAVAVAAVALAITVRGSWDWKATRAHTVIAALFTACWTFYCAIGLPALPVGTALGLFAALGHAAVAVKHMRQRCALE